MQATRLIVETNEHGQIVYLPPLSPNVRMEAIFLVLDEPPASRRRQPPPEIAGKGRILGDIISPVGDWTPPEPRSLGSFQVPVDDWRLLANEPADRTLP